MKILFVHNKYGKLSGEERMVDSFIRLLKDNNHEVEFFSRDSSSLRNSPAGFLWATINSFYSRSTLKELETLLNRFKPDIVQVQNIYPLISPHIFRLIKKHKVPVVMRCANYRLFCPTGLMLRDNKICEKCATRTHLFGLVHNCENNIARSFVYAIRNEYARVFDLIHPYVDAYIVPSLFQKSKFSSWGVDPKKIHVLPNVLQPLEQTANSKFKLGDYVGYAGRISPEKGIQLILDSAKLLPHIPFKLAGHGLGSYVNTLDFPDNVEYLGMLNGNDFTNFYQNCRFLVIPSQWYETFGLVALEALQHNKPVIASKIGALQETILDGENGFLFPHDDLNSFIEKINQLWKRPDLVEKFSLNASTSLEHRFGEKTFYRSLLTIYQSVVN